MKSIKDIENFHIDCSELKNQYSILPFCIIPGKVYTFKDKRYKEVYGNCCKIVEKTNTYITVIMYLKKERSLRKTPNNKILTNRLWFKEQGNTCGGEEIYGYTVVGDSIINIRDKKLIRQEKIKMMFRK